MTWLHCTCFIEPHTIAGCLRTLHIFNLNIFCLLSDILSQTVVPPQVRLTPCPADKYIDDSYSKSEIHLGHLQNERWMPLYNTNISASAANVLMVAFSEESYRSMHDEHGLQPLTVSPWTVDYDDSFLLNQPTTYKRSVEYTSIVGSVELFCAERFRFYGRNSLVMDTVISSPTAKSGSNYRVLMHYMFMENKDPLGAPQCGMNCFIAFEWIKKTMMKSKIMKAATRAMKERVAMWALKVEQYFIEHQPPIVPAPVQQQQEIEYRLVTPAPAFLDYGSLEADEDDLVAGIIAEEARGKQQGHAS